MKGKRERTEEREILIIRWRISPLYDRRWRCRRRKEIVSVRLKRDAIEVGRPLALSAGCSGALNPAAPDDIIF